MTSRNSTVSAPGTDIRPLFLRIRRESPRCFRRSFPSPRNKGRYSSDSASHRRPSHRTTGSGSLTPLNEETGGLGGDSATSCRDSGMERCAEWVCLRARVNPSYKTTAYRVFSVVSVGARQGRRVCVSGTRRGRASRRDRPTTPTPEGVGGAGQTGSGEECLRGLYIVLFSSDDSSWWGAVAPGVSEGDPDASTRNQPVSLLGFSRIVCSHRRPHYLHGIHALNSG